MPLPPPRVRQCLQVVLILTVHACAIDGLSVVKCSYFYDKNKGIVQALFAGFPPQFHLGFVVDKVGLGRFISKYFGFPFQFSSHQLLQVH
jgi:hypothetical protein